MAVKVVITRSNDGGQNKVEEFATANAVAIDDGHLKVKSQGTNGPTVAVFAPGSWTSAEATD